MKRLYITGLLLGSLSGMPILSAQSVSDTPVQSLGYQVDGEAYVPAEFTADGKPLMIFCEAQDIAGRVCNVFDAKLNNVARINLSGEMYASQELFLPSEMAFDYEHELDFQLVGYCGDEEAVEVFVKELFGTVPYKVVVSGGYRYYYPQPDVELSFYPMEFYYNRWDFGTKYPAIAYRCNVITDEMHPFKIEKASLHRGYIASKYQEQPIEQKFTSLEKYVYLRIEDYNTGIEDEIPMLVSQTLFNSDEKFEYVSPIYSPVTTEHVVNTDGQHYKEVYHEYNMIGFQIKSETGESIQSVNVNLPENYETSGFMYLVLIDDAKYLTVDCINRISYDRIKLFYEIIPDGGTTVVRQVGEPIRTSVRPTVVKEGEGVNVNVDGVGEKLRLSVTDMGGRTVYSTEFEGDGQHKVPGAAMRRGMNVVTVSAEGKEPASTKVLVR